MVAPGRIQKLYPENKAHPEPDDVSHRRRVTAVCWSQKLAPESTQAESPARTSNPGIRIWYPNRTQLGANSRYPEIGSQPDLLNC